MFSFIRYINANIEAVKSILRLNNYVDVYFIVLIGTAEIQLVSHLYELHI